MRPYPAPELSPDGHRAPAGAGTITLPNLAGRETSPSRPPTHLQCVRFDYLRRSFNRSVMSAKSGARPDYPSSPVDGLDR